MSEQTFDIAIVGAGPAGCATAICLNESGLKVALIDKSVFPRDKICGDAISPDVLNQLQKMPLDSGLSFQKLSEKLECKAVKFIAPNYTSANLYLPKYEIDGHIITRYDFDWFMYQQAIKNENVTAICGNAVKTIESNENCVNLMLDNGQVISSKMIVGADGAHSVVAKQLADQKIDRDHHCAGLRVYYENVSGFDAENNAIELHFYKELLPGYFWIFPLPNHRANVGLGMLSSHVAKYNVNIKEKLKEIIETHPNVAPRFKNAKALESIKGFGLPLGSQKISLSGDRYLLTGDAASLINPLSGEGVGNAIRSGRIAAEHIIAAFRKSRFDADFNQAYDREVYRRMWGELKINHWMQRIMSRPLLANFVVRRAIGNPSVQKIIMSGFNAELLKVELRKAAFYKELLFGKTASN